MDFVQIRLKSTAFGWRWYDVHTKFYSYNQNIDFRNCLNTSNSLTVFQRTRLGPIGTLTSNLQSVTMTGADWLLHWMHVDMLPSRGKYEWLSRRFSFIARDYCMCNWKTPGDSVQALSHVPLLFSLRSLFWKNKVGLWDHVAVCVCVSARARFCVCLRIPLIVARQRFGKNPLIVARERLGKNPLIVPRQRLGRNVTAVTNTHATIDELLEASFSMWPCRIKGM
jgi:hypothetical protein